jgi:putative ABC transport system permease protein
LAAALEQEYPGTNRGWTVALQPLREMRTAGWRTSLLVLVGAVGLVLVVACVNLANLMLTRGVARTPELALRLSLGATPGTLARGVLAESVLLAMVGGMLGASLAAATLPALATQLPAGLVPRTQEIGVDTTALFFAIAISMLTGVVFGSLPAWQVFRANVNELLKAGHGRGLAGGFARRLQATLIVAQLALTVIVLAGAGLLMRSLLALQRTDLGFDPHHLHTLRIATNVNKWREFTALALYYERVLDELRRVPGVETASLNCSTPLSGITLRFPFSVQGRPRAEGGADEAVFNSVDLEYFKTLRIPLRQGRLFESRDHERAPTVCVISAALAQRLFPGENPLGRRIQIVPWLNRGFREVIGVVGDVKQSTQADPPQPQIYVPSRQSPWFFTLLLVRAGPNVTVPALQAAVRRADPTLSMAAGTLDDAVAGTAAQPRLRALLFAIFGATALLLSAFGLYASMSFSVSQRVREIGVRLALGATPRDVLGWLLGRAARLTAVGMLTGLIGAVLLSELLRGLLYGVSPIDPLVLGSIALFLPLVALLATLAPALRASRLKPMQALQHE